MKRRAITGLGVALLLAAWTAPVQAGPLVLPLGVVDGKLAGPGAAELRAALPGAQFILLGEDHGFADSPVLLRALAREARPLGFDHLVVEVGPLSTRMAGEALARGGLAGLAKAAAIAPRGFSFLSLKDDAALASDFLGADAHGTPYLWGVDQEFIGGSVYQLRRLMVLAPNAAAREAVRALLAQEQAAMVSGKTEKFLLARLPDAAFARLARDFYFTCGTDVFTNKIKYIESFLLRPTMRTKQYPGANRALSQPGRREQRQLGEVEGAKARL